MPGTFQQTHYCKASKPGLEKENHDLQSQVETLQSMYVMCTFELYKKLCVCISMAWTPHQAYWLLQSFLSFPGDRSKGFGVKLPCFPGTGNILLEMLGLNSLVPGNVGVKLPCSWKCWG